jgi:hypothetical protein
MIINKITQRIGELVQDGKLSNDDLVQIIEVAGSFLNLQTIPKYCNDTGMSYNGVKHHRQIKELFGVKFVIDNE